jgi:hypothetical protein
MKRFWSLFLASALLFSGYGHFTHGLNAAPNPDKQAIEQVVKQASPGDPPIQITKARISGNYALVNWREGDGGGQTLLQKKDGRWIILESGGGQMDENTLIKAGVPKNYAKALTKGLK